MIGLERARVMVAMTKQVEKRQITDATIDRPGMVRPDRFVAPGGIRLATQTIVLDVIRPIKAEYCDQALQQEERTPTPAPQRCRDGQPKQRRQIPNRQVHCAKSSDPTAAAGRVRIAAPHADCRLGSATRSRISNRPGVPNRSRDRFDVAMMNAQVHDLECSETSRGKRMPPRARRTRLRW